MTNFFLNMKLKYMLTGSVLFLGTIFVIWLHIPVDGFVEIDPEFEDGKRVLTDDSVDFEYEDEEEMGDIDISERVTEIEDGIYRDFEVERTIPPVAKAKEYAEEKKLPVMLWWTSFTHDEGKLKRCFAGDCLFTVNRTYLNNPNTRALLFYGTDIRTNDLPLPRKPQHDWAIFHEESPKNQALFFFKDFIELFNHTATFKQQSDYPITTQYIRSAQYLLKPLAFTFEGKNILKEHHNLSSVAYIQTGCNPPSDRDAYIQELMKYIDIDSYGKCLHNKDLPGGMGSVKHMHSKKFIEYMTQYKFVLSFENGICDDYMTEKLFRTLNTGAIPVYKGAPNVREWLPDNHSAIVVDDFESPAALAEYIKSVDADRDKYNAYLEYKSRGIQNQKLLRRLEERQWGVNSHYKMGYITGFECHVCDQIHHNLKLQEQNKPPVVRIATMEHYGCPKPLKYDLPDVKGSEDWEREMWEWDYETGEKQVNGLKEKVRLSMQNESEL